MAFAFLAAHALPMEAQNNSLQKDAATVAIAKNHPNQDLRQAAKDCLQGQIEKALPVIQNLNGAGDLDARYMLAKLYFLGLGVERSSDKALKLLTSSIDKEHGPSILALAQFKETDAPQESIRLYEQAANQGQTLAWIRLGNIAENGELGMRANSKRAFYYFQLASQNGNRYGDFQMARCFENGIGVSPNSIEATRHYRKAALGGVRNANSVMAQRYLGGQGVELDPVAATGWMMRGAKLGSAEAMVQLGKEYESGLNLARDLNQAGQLYSAAAKTGDPEGNYRLALLYLNGIGTKADPVRAYVLLHEAQAIPAAKKAYQNLERKLTEQQLEFARTKISAAQNTP